MRQSHNPFSSMTNPRIYEDDEDSVNEVFANTAYPKIGSGPMPEMHTAERARLNTEGAQRSDFLNTEDKNDEINTNISFL